MRGMNIIVYGTKKCQGTKKALRFFSDRGISAQFRDLNENPLTSGELANMSRGKSPSDLLDTGSAKYIKKGFAFMEFDPLEELEADNGLLVTPVVRLDNKYYINPPLEELPLK
jgi:arsenate reductase-like glutaredoxin family protein